MITYDYHCDANGETITVSHVIKETLTTWGDLCSLADHCLGQTPPQTPVRRLISFEEPKPDESTLSMLKIQIQWWLLRVLLTRILIELAMIKNIIPKYLFLIGFFIFHFCSLDAQKKNKWIQLFNGKDLSDWTVKIRGHDVGINHNDTFSVKEGVIRVSYDKYENFNKTYGHIFYKTPFSHYLLRIEYRLLGDQAPVGKAGHSKQ